MKHFIILLTGIFFAAILMASPARNTEMTLFEKFADVNKEWLKHSFDDAELQQTFLFENDEALIQMHLLWVEKKLRNAYTSHLNVEQKQNRKHYLDILKEYALAGKFPQNTFHPNRTPYFIDIYGTACAVGYLMLHSDAKAFAYKISAENNYAYICQMPYKEIHVWAAQNGFTVDELAWIQPGYSEPPATTVVPLGDGVDGTVNAFTIDTDNGILYIGGNFSEANNMQASNIVAYDGNNWSQLGSGVNGKINTMLMFDNKLYVGGSFTEAGGVYTENIAIWDGSNWSSPQGGLYGKVHALTVYGNSILAGGWFQFGFNPYAYYSVMEWDGNVWVPWLNSPDGPVHAIHVEGDDIYLGGDFMNTGNVSTPNIVLISNGNITALDGGLDFVVHTLTYLDLGVGNLPTLYAGGALETDSNFHTKGFSSFDGISWTSLSSIMGGILPPVGGNGKVSKLYTVNNDVIVCGNFEFYPMYGNHGKNIISMNTGAFALEINDDVNAFVEFDNKKIIGGNFTSVDNATVKRIGYVELPTSVKQFSSLYNMKVFPNVASDKITVEIDYPNLSNLTIHIINNEGKVVRSVNNVSTNKTEISRNSLASGLYFVNVSDGNSTILQSKVLFD